MPRSFMPGPMVAAGLAALGDTQAEPKLRTGMDKVGASPRRCTKRNSLVQAVGRGGGVRAAATIDDPAPADGADLFSP